MSNNTQKKFLETIKKIDNIDIMLKYKSKGIYNLFFIIIFIFFLF